jgi:F-type H+-transporting ATPase subunit a
MDLSPDWTVYGHLGMMPINATLVFTWAVMALLSIGSWLVTRRMVVDAPVSRWQNLVEVLVDGTARQLEGVMHRSAQKYVSFLGTLFLFILTCNVLSVVPGFQPPTGSLSTTAALAIVVLVAVPVWGINEVGLRVYLRSYTEPSVFILPMIVIGEISRTIALAVRLFGNVMNGTIVTAILLALAPVVIPVAVHILGLVAAVIQAYVFTLLAAVFIGAAIGAHEDRVRSGSEASES